MPRSLFRKALTTAALAVIILIALLPVNGIIEDRQKYREAAVTSIEASYAGPQTLIGPVLVRPYTRTTESTETDEKGVRRIVLHTEERIATSFPRDLALDGAMLPGERRHGLYKVEVYELQARLRARFEIDDQGLTTEGTIAWGEPYLALAVTDVRGIVGRPGILVNGNPRPIVQGAPALGAWQPNLHVPLTGMASLKGELNVALDLHLAGTETLSLAPIGDTNLVELRSAWRSPLFAGQFLPRTREIAKSGFHAVWEVSSLASATQVQLLANPARPVDLMTVSLTTLLDPYSLGARALKYGILFIVLTFGGFFIFEITKQLPIHPVQYLLVGFGLAIFFLLLISLSEHMSFGLAYLLATLACVALLTLYLSSVLRSTTRGLAFGALLTTFYAAIYGLLLSEDNALILGSLLLFALLATVMYVTRNIDWYRSQPTDSHNGKTSTPIV